MFDLDLIVFVRELSIETSFYCVLLGLTFTYLRAESITSKADLLGVPIATTTGPRPILLKFNLIPLFFISTVTSLTLLYLYEVAFPASL